MAGPSEKIVGTDMTPEMLERARATAHRKPSSKMSTSAKATQSVSGGPDGWADVVISNGVVNLYWF